MIIMLFPTADDSMDYLFIFSRALCFDWCKRSRRRRVTEGIGWDSPTEGVKAGEVMREMEFAGSV